jgi:hypothetical protein
MTAPTSNLKSAKRPSEKIRRERASDLNLLKDPLRGPVVCRDVAGMMMAWKALKRLKTEGVLMALQVKNGHRGSSTPGGHRDINMNVRFEGLICEIKMHTAGHCELKGEQHICCELCRSAGLVGDIKGFDKMAPSSMMERHSTRSHGS